MQSGHIQQFAHLSQFQTVKEFNDSIRNFLHLHGDSFTEGEHIALLTLVRYSVKLHGICNAKICKLLEATNASGHPISRTTFERMLRKGRKLGLLTSYNTFRKKGGKSHNVYVFHRVDVSRDNQLTHCQLPQTPTTPSSEPIKNHSEALLLKSKKLKDKDLRNETFESLDHTFVPSSIPTSFVKAAKPFFPHAREICALWDRAKIAYKAREYNDPIENYLDIIIQAFKQTVYKHKRKQIKTSFMQYFYGVLIAMLPMGIRLSFEQREFVSWLDKFEVEAFNSKV
ncbi:hypothetical protein [Halalkalibacter alkaliphilus]|uniref:Helix-turn-helix domain-containing protein n=1 Tax=Halalkalibacter alkaliphilus TaxID=2917993 RepID=A0A9X2CVT1_9BACI|nr:hypothetical protein [Halalkalibacter alkaliphilus]MCL7749187.1 hypothetical protein [Halalkalibacter alkaliphilus]